MATTGTTPKSTSDHDKPDTTAAAETADAALPEPTDPRAHVRVDTAEAHTDRVAMVSRDRNGKPDQSSDYEIADADKLTAAQKRAAENRPADNQVD